MLIFIVIMAALNDFYYFRSVHIMDVIDISILVPSMVSRESCFVNSAY